MTGGKGNNGDGAGYDRLMGEKADYDGRGIYKRITNIQNYIDSTSISGTRCIKFTVGASSPSSFDVLSSSNCTSGSSLSRNVAVRVPTPVEGILQNVVGARARIGLTFYKTNEGGLVQGVCFRW